MTEEQRKMANFILLNGLPRTVYLDSFMPGIVVAMYTYSKDDNEPLFHTRLEAIEHAFSKSESKTTIKGK